MPNGVSVVLREALLEKIGEPDIPLPLGWKTGEVYRWLDYTYVMRGARDLRFRIYFERGDFHLDYVFATDHYTAHGRVLSDGSTEQLESYSGQFGRPVLETEEATRLENERIAAHNQWVNSVIEEKGLGHHA